MYEKCNHVSNKIRQRLLRILHSKLMLDFAFCFLRKNMNTLTGKSYKKVAEAVSPSNGSNIQHNYSSTSPGDDFFKFELMAHAFPKC